MKSALFTLCVCLVCVFAGSGTQVYAQDVSKEIQEIQHNLGKLKEEVAKLRDLVTGQVGPTQKPPQSSASTSTPSNKQAKTFNKAKVKTEACEPVRNFVSEVDAALSLSDASVAEARMDKALAHLQSALAPYSQDKAISKILSLASMTAYDTTNAVALQMSTEGNQDFLDMLSQYKRRFRMFCGEK